MKNLVLSLALLLSTSVAFGKTVAQLTVAETFILSSYLLNYEPNEPILTSIDEDTVNVVGLKFQGQRYIMLQVWSGENPVGPIYSPESLKIVGENSDDSIKIHGKWIKDEEILWEKN